MNIAAWLNAIGMNRYEDAFLENDIDYEILLTLTADDLRDLGVSSVGHRRKILNAIQALANNEITVEPAPIAFHQNAVASPERRQLTVLFCDLVGSTELSGQLDPEDLAQVIRRYQEACKATIDRWDGHVAKYLGDGVLAYFGYPIAHEDDAERSVRAGLDMNAAVGAIDIGDGKFLSSRVGIATGLVMVGELIGEGSSQEEAVVGETPNLAARLEGLAKPGTVAIAPQTRHLLGDLFVIEDLGAQELKGFKEPIAVSIVAGAKTAASRFEARSGSNLTPLVGRQHETTLLEDLWQHAVDGHGQVALIAGEAGIGKSRMIESLRVRLGNQPHTRLRYQCSPFHPNSAFYPITEQLKQAADFGRNDSINDRLDKLEALLAHADANPSISAPLLASLLSLTTDRYADQNLTPQRQKERTLEILIDQLRGLAGQQPILMLFEDLHWIDPTSLELLDLVVEQIDDLSVFAVFTYRPDFQPKWVGQANVHTLQLNRLSKQQCAAMVERVTQGKSLPEQVMNHIITKTDGVPLFVEELTKTILESGILEEQDEAFTLDGDMPSLAIPTSLQDSLLARLDRLAPIKEVAQAGAVIGREFSFTLLSAISPQSSLQLQSALDKLVAAELVFGRGSPPDATYTFKHALVQDAAYQSLLKSKRRQIHAQIANALNEQFSDIADQRPELLAYHFMEAGDFERATPKFLVAGRKAARTNALIEAKQHLLAGLTALEKLPDTPSRNDLALDLNVALGSVSIGADGPTAFTTSKLYQRIHKLAKVVDDPKRVCSALHGVWQAYTTNKADHDAASDIAREMLAIANRHKDTTTQFIGRRFLAASLFGQGAIAAASKEFELALDLLPEGGLPDDVILYSFDLPATLRAMRSVLLWVAGYPDLSAQDALVALERAEVASNNHTTAHVTHYAGSICNTLLGNFDAVCSTTRTSTELAHQHGFPHWLALAKVLRGIAVAHANNEPSGLSLAKEALSELDQVGWHQFRPFFLAMTANAALSVGETSEAKAISEAAMALQENSNEVWAKSEVIRVSGDVLAATSTLGLAETAYRQAIEIAHLQEAKSWELRSCISLARLLNGRGDRDQAQSILQPVYEWFTEGFDTRGLKEAKHLLDDIGG